MEAKVPVGKMAELHWSSLTEMARQAKIKEADAVVDALNASMPPGRVASWAMGWKGVQLTIRIPRKR